MFLFEHDRRITREFGEGAYARWLDDQNIGTASLTEARRTINAITRSLDSQRLTVNAAKTRFLTPDDVVLHFQLEPNESLDEWATAFKDVDFVEP